MHMIIFFHPDAKLCTLEEVDSLLSARFPNEETQPELFEQYFSVPHRFQKESPDSAGVGLDSTGVGPESAGVGPESAGVGLDFLDSLESAGVGPESARVTRMALE
jgi:hypothetical protein